MKMDSRSSIENKLRQYVYLGNNSSLRVYTPPAQRNLYFKKDMLLYGFQLIEDLVKKCEVKNINSIVPLLIKIKNEHKLHDEDLLIFLLAVCTKFNLTRCARMISEAYAGVSVICSDALQILKFAKFCSIVNDFLYFKRYTGEMPSGFGSSFRRTINKWYLHRDPFLTTKQILKHNSYGGWTHKKIMNLIHMQSDKPSYHIFITHTMYGMKEVERLYKSIIEQIEIDNENYHDYELKRIYNYLQQVNYMNNMNVETLQKEIELNKWGEQFEMIPQKMLNSPKILTSLIMHMPLKEILDRTNFFRKQKLFSNKNYSKGLKKYILQLTNSVLLPQSEIHPIEPFIEFIKFSRNRLQILNERKEKTSHSQVLKKTENKNDGNISSQNMNTNSTASLEYVASTSQMTIQSEDLTNSNVENNEKKCDEMAEVLKILKNKTYQIQKTNCTLFFNAEHESMENGTGITKHNKKKTKEHNMKTANNKSKLNNKNNNKKAIPKLQKNLKKFLSKDLLTKTLKNLKLSEKRILILYEKRPELKTIPCVGTQLVNVQEAIVLLTLCLVYPVKNLNIPLILGANRLNRMDQVKINYSLSLNHAYLQSLMFETSNKNVIPKRRDKISFYANRILNVARKHNKLFDVFIFMGTNIMSFMHINNAITEYQALLIEPVKIIIFCLNGKHKEQAKLKHDNILLIYGIDKSVGKVVNSFLNNEF